MAVQVIELLPFMCSSHCRDVVVQKLQDRLTDTKDLVERVEDERSVAIKSAAGNAQQTDQVRRVTDKLREEWAQVRLRNLLWFFSLHARLPGIAFSRYLLRLCSIYYFWLRPKALQWPSG